MSSSRNIRLFVYQTLFSGGRIVLEEKASHYLNTVMRCAVGESIKCFNAADGEFWAEIKEIDKKRTVIEIKEQQRLPVAEPDIWLIFAPLKKDKTDFVIEKAVELGVAKIIPVMTARTNNARIKIERFESQATEAAEQCGRLSVPDIEKQITLKELIKKWDVSRTLFFMDERRQGVPAVEVFKNSSQKVALLIGPEGGFDEEEKNLLDKYSFVKNVSLGPRILRAETAATAALSVWQAVAGDWRKD